MGQFRISVYGNWQLGLLSRVTSDEVVVFLPFMTIHIATTKNAGGIFIFGHYF